MRIGLSVGIEHSSPEDWMEKLKRWNCSCAIFPSDYKAEESVIMRYVELAEENNIVIGEMGAWCNPLAEDPEERKNAMERCIEQLRLADAIGTRCCVNITGAAGPRWDGVYRGNFTKEHYKKIVRSIQEIIDAANPQNTYYTIEPMPWMVPMGPKEYQRLLEDVDREKFAVHMDFANMITSFERYFFADEFMDECFDLLGDKIKSCHMKDVKLIEDFYCHLKEVHCGEGILDLKHYARRMQEINPDMTVYVEHLHTEEEYVKCMNYAREHLKEFWS